MSKRLLTINRQFYQQFAADFDATRQRPQPGVARITAGIEPNSRILDLGCGNGSFRKLLIDAGHRGDYTGLDFSPRLLDFARQSASDDRQARYLQGDFSSDNWDSGLEAPFDLICAFAVVHHLPSALLAGFFDKIRRLLSPAPSSSLVFSTWQFLNSPKLLQRIVPWEIVGIDPDELGPKDYLLDWRRGGLGYRYVHLYEAAELESLARKTGFTVESSFLSDGRSGELALYQTWKPSNFPIEPLMLSDLNEEEISDLLALLLSCFPPGEDWPEENPEARFMGREAARLAAGVKARRALVWRAGKPAAHAAIFNRKVRTAGGYLAIGALSAVCVAEDRRRSGLGSQVVQRLFDLVDAGEYDVALWQTTQTAFYESLGARVVENTWVNSQNQTHPNEDPWPDETKMIYPAGFAWPKGSIDLNGPPF